MPFLDRLRSPRAAAISAAVITLGAVAAIASTYRTFSAVFDEPAHIAAGLEWLTGGSYSLEEQHPPLGRAAAAFPEFLARERSIGPLRVRIVSPIGSRAVALFAEGRRLLGEGEHFRSRLAESRAAELPFFILLCAVAFAWGRAIAGPWAGTLGVGFIVTNPNVLAHAGLATIDAPVTAGYLLALYALRQWMAAPTGRNAALIGATVAFAGATKFSAFGFFGTALPIALALFYRQRRDAPPPARRTLWSHLGIGALVGGLALWMVYRFQFGQIEDTGLRVPAPALFIGLRDYVLHSAAGHPGFLFGEVRQGGWWYYYLVALAVKTPLPLVTGFSIGTWAMWKDRHAIGVDAVVLCAGAVAVVIDAMVNRVDTGIRHVLPVYGPMALIASYGVMSFLRGLRAQRLVGVGVIATSLAVVARAYPDNIAYFNPLAGSHPERVLSDSNIDWGQDLYRLADVAQRRHISRLTIAYFGAVVPGSAGVDGSLALGPDRRVSGWIAASETLLTGLWSGHSLEWLAKREPVERVGKSIRLYYVAPDDPDLRHP